MPTRAMPPISVVICTRTRPEELRGCLDSVRSLEYEQFEIVVVDNTEDGALVHGLATGERTRVVREAHPGLSRARNTGIRAARFDIIAFTDDDVLVDPGWLRAIAVAFEPGEVAGVTGLVAAAELETEAQREFEWYGGMNKGRERRICRGTAMSPRDTIVVQNLGVGANMAFRRTTFDRVGGFDEALGAGTVTLGAEDLDLFHRVLRAGLTLRYEPAAAVRHRHRQTVAELRSQIFANGCAYSVYLMKIWDRRSASRTAVARVALSWFAGRLATALFRVVARPGVRCVLAWEEVSGACHAFAVYPRAYRSSAG